MSDNAFSVEQTLDAIADNDVAAIFAALRRYAQRRRQSMLELIIAYATDDLPVGLSYTLEEYLEEQKSPVQPGEVEERTFFASGGARLSERVEEIIYGPCQHGGRVIDGRC